MSLEDAFASKAAVREASGHRFGAEPPVLDGVDLSPILLDEQHGEVGSWETSKGHDCILLYTSPQDAGPSAPAHGLGAVRCGNYKAHFFTTSTGRIPAPVPNGLHQPPVLFNLGVFTMHVVLIGRCLPVEQIADTGLLQVLTAERAIQSIQIPPSMSKLCSPFRQQLPLTLPRWTTFRARYENMWHMCVLGPFSIDVGDNACWSFCRCSTLHPVLRQLPRCALVATTQAVPCAKTRTRKQSMYLFNKMPLISYS